MRTATPLVTCSLITELSASIIALESSRAAVHRAGMHDQHILFAQPDGILMDAEIPVVFAQRGQKTP